MSTSNTEGWVLTGDQSLQMDSLGDGDSISLTFKNIDWAVQTLTLDASTGGDSELKLEQLSRVEGTNDGVLIYPAFTFTVPLEADTGKNYYVAFKLIDTANYLTYYGAL